MASITCKASRESLGMASVDRFDGVARNYRISFAASRRHHSHRDLNEWRLDYTMTTLHDPLAAGTLRLPNRILMAAMTRSRADDAAIRDRKSTRLNSSHS